MGGNGAAGGRGPKDTAMRAGAGLRNVGGVRGRKSRARGVVGDLVVGEGSKYEAARRHPCSGRPV